MENLEQSNNKNVSLSLIAEYSSESDSEDKSNENPANDDSDTVELSEMVLKNNIINACAHGPLSSTSNEEVTRHMIIDSCENDVLEYDVTEYRDADTSSDSDTDEASDSDDSIKDIEELTSGDELEGGKADKSIPKVKGELSLDDLPPIEDLAISLPAQETTKIGTITSVVDRLVVVRAYPETPAVDLDTVLFLDNGAKALGKVFDVFGPVTEPHYCVRFNSEEHVKERGVSAGMDVYIAPRSTDHTSYVFLTDLMKTKGSDASWLHDIEPPPNQVEYSDDEEERRANRARKEQRQRQDGADSGETSKNQPRKILEAKRNRPTQSSSRFGPNRGRMPVGFRRNPGFRPQRPWDDQMRTPPPHPDMGPMPPFQAFPPFGPPHMNRFNFGRPMRPNWPQQFRQNAPVFGASFCNMPGPQPQWTKEPPPPGT